MASISLSKVKTSNIGALPEPQAMSPFTSSKDRHLGVKGLTAESRRPLEKRLSNCANVSLHILNSGEFLGGCIEKIYY